MKLTFPDRDLSLHMEGGYCVVDGDRYCRLLTILDDGRGLLRDVVREKDISVRNMFSDNIDWSWPVLGMRNIGAEVYYLCRHPVAQYRRTIKPNNVRSYRICPEGVLRGRDSRVAFSKQFIEEVFKPSYTSAKLAVWALATGKAAARAITNKLALVVQDSDDDNRLILFYKTHRIGLVNPDTWEVEVEEDLVDSKVATYALTCFDLWRNEDAAG